MKETSGTAAENVGKKSLNENILRKILVTVKRYGLHNDVIGLLRLREWREFAYDIRRALIQTTENFGDIFGNFEVQIR